MSSQWTAPAAADPRIIDAVELMLGKKAAVDAKAAEVEQAATAVAASEAAGAAHAEAAGQSATAAAQSQAVAAVHATAAGTHRTAAESAKAAAQAHAVEAAASAPQFGTQDEAILAITDPVGIAAFLFLAGGGLRSALIDLDTGTGAFELADEHGAVIARVDETGLRVGGLSVGEGGAQFDRGLTIGGDAGCSIVEWDGPEALVITDEDGWVLAYIDGQSRLHIQSVVTEIVSSSGDYSPADIAERNARALALSSLDRQAIDEVSAAPVWRYNHIMVDGQSLGEGAEAWPAKTVTGRSDVLMVGQSVRPGGADTDTAPTPLGDANFHPAIATVQSRITGALYDAAAQATLPSGDPNYLGEEIGVAAALFARRLFLRKLGQASADDRQFVVTNVCTGAKTLEQLSSGAAPELFNRLLSMSTAAKTAATAASGSYGVLALMLLQGEFNMTTAYGGTTDKAAYKALSKQFYDDFVARVCVDIAEQTDLPAMITYVTGGQFMVDAADMSIQTAQLELSEETPGWYVAAPSYPYTDKGGHLDANGSRWMALKFGQVLFETCINRRKWRPLSPRDITYRGSTVLIDFHVWAPPLQWQPVYVGSVATMYTDRGFAVIDAVGLLTLVSVEIVADTVVRIVCGRELVGPVSVYVGRKAAHNGGSNLCDSDSLIAPYVYEYAAGSGDYAEAEIAALVGKPYPSWNWCVPFKRTAIAN